MEGRKEPSNRDLPVVARESEQRGGRGSILLLLQLYWEEQRWNDKAQFRQNQAKAEISVYRQFAWVNCVKYKRNQGVHLRGDTGRLIQLKIPF